MPTEARQRRRTQVALFLAALAVMVSLVGSGIALVERFHDTNQRRDIAVARDIAIANSIRTVLCLARQQVVSDKTIPTERRKTAIHFYDKALRSIHAQACAPLVRPRR